MSVISYIASRLSLILVGLCLLSSVVAEENVSETLLTEQDPSIALLALAKSIVKSDAEQNNEREKLFALALEDQTKLLKASEKRLLKAEKEQERLKALFDLNEETLSELETKLTQRSGALGEVFGVAKESALELMPMLQDSVTSADYPNRKDALAFAESKRIPTIKEFQVLLEQLKTEMKATGQVASFEAPVIDVQGKLSDKQVMRFGVFASSLASGEYLAWDVPQQALKVLATQPNHQVKSDTENDLATTTVLLDPSRGELFALLDRMPNLMERIDQGGTVGYFIIALGILGVVVALVQIARLLMTEVGVRKQLSNGQNLNENNPLGRVLSAVHKSENALEDDKLEMRVDEAILKELPAIEQGQSFLKLLAAVAPLLGLLGTVVGMIATFQSITLFGTSDPKLMASGISQALMTTVLGLVVAVPVLFCHSLLVARGRRLVQILQEKSLAALASVTVVDAPHPSSEQELHVA